MLLEGKVALISGVGPGLGRATALAYAREGASVGLAARSEAFLAETAAEIQAAGGRAVVVPTNIADPDACAAAVARTVEAFGSLDVLVNSAFRGDPSVPFEAVDLVKWRKVYDVNVWGTLQLTQAAIAPMKAAGGGAIVFVNSMSARKIRVNEGAYASSKGALNTAVQSLALELGPYRIRVNAVVPGWMWGPNVQTYVQWQVQSRNCTEADVVAELEAEIPLGFVPPQEDVADAIVFMGSDMARSITGQSLDVNGGEWFH
ncbi:MAG: dehydrogenase, short-chain alcohol dehydrogenase like [Actinomycetia bacterium]|nr:dehydrogenase, short-chain alcohol dehydrogenase like [Actinomycetes bacterium]